MGYLIEKTLELKKISAVLDNSEILDLHNTAKVIDNISADAKIVSIKCFCNATISGYSNLYVIDNNSGSNVGNLKIGNLANNYNYYFAIGVADFLVQEGFNLKQNITSLGLICQDPITSIATSLTIEIYYFE